ncbi:MAG: ABC transporter ATP-binding protein [Desulfovibrionales bacterium]|nr:MAG: ABC transporter ATP-binding protein [Desulfovibrionales bacterium]
MTVTGKPVALAHVSKLFGDARAVDDVTFTAQAGKITTLLGPSGCGKTTTLRLIGGFHEADVGEIRIGDTRVNELPAHARSSRTVFQSYALFPHMTVFENVAFGLRATSVPRGDISRRVERALDKVGLEDLGQRQPGRLSGGQQQRVAFARALVTEPEVLLLDEPLSNLDAKLRIQMRREIRYLQQELGITTIYVTHDQEEAMSLSDHVIVMHNGRIEQQGAPHDIYEKPATRFVADFIGISNFVPAVILHVDEDKLRVAALGLELNLSRPPARDFSPGDEATLVVRPEHLCVQAGPEAKPATSQACTGTLEGLVEDVHYLGAMAAYFIVLSGNIPVIVHHPAPMGATLRQPGETIRLGLDLDRIYIVAE